MILVWQIHPFFFLSTKIYILQITLLLHSMNITYYISLEYFIATHENKGTVYLIKKPCFFSSLAELGYWTTRTLGCSSSLHWLSICVKLLADVSWIFVVLWLTFVLWGALFFRHENHIFPDIPFAIRNMFFVMKQIKKSLITNIQILKTLIFPLYAFILTEYSSFTLKHVDRWSKSENDKTCTFDVQCHNCHIWLELRSIFNVSFRSKHNRNIFIDPCLLL